jgi:PAS domain S-box-containing protein
MMDTAAIGIISVDEKGILNVYNLVAESMFGYSSSEALHKNVSMLMSQPFPESHNNYLQQIQEKGERRIIGVGREVTGQRKDGSTFPLQVGVSEFSAQGQRVFTGILLDITRNKWNEKQLIAAKDKAEEATRVKADFMASISHEIRTPMNGVLGMLELLEHGNLEEKQRSFVETAQNSARSLMKMVNGILDFSESEAGQLVLEYNKFDLRQVFQDALKPFINQATEKGLNLECAIPMEIPKNLFGDPLRLTQIISDLTDNAIKFTEQGEIYLSISIAREADEHISLRFEIRDTGIGIPLEKQGNLFDAFTQEDNSTTRKFGGTGLGLSIAKKLTELMGGEIGIRSNQEEGATFWFTANFGK